MTDAKTYLNVPFAQKDTAKALGAKWDPALKKWYAPTNKDLALFAQWHTDTEPVTSNQETTKLPPAMRKNPATGVFTYAADKNFIAYDGEAPPWD